MKLKNIKIYIENEDASYSIIKDSKNDGKYVTAQDLIDELDANEQNDEITELAVELTKLVVRNGDDDGIKRIIKTATKNITQTFEGKAVDYAAKALCAQLDEYGW